MEYAMIDATIVKVTVTDRGKGTEQDIGKQRRLDHQNPALTDALGNLIRSICCGATLER